MNCTLLFAVCRSLLVCALLSAHLSAAPAPRPNLLFLMTDQQRWDALGYSGNKHIATPNLDRLAREGVCFDNMYSSCPVCVPARSVILTGLSIESVGILNNDAYEFAAKAGKDVPTFDNLLSRAGYYTEYWGKWHIPHKYAATYNNVVRPCVPKGVEGRKLESEGAAYEGWLTNHHVKINEPMPGVYHDEYGRPYRPLPMDITEGGVGAAKALKKKGVKSDKKDKVSQGSEYGCLLIPPELTMTAFTAGESIEALERAHKTSKPFSITCSMGPPHPPMLAPEPFYSQFPADTLPLPESLNDPATDSPYRAKALDAEQQKLYRNPQNVRQMKQIYYAMVADTDAWVGRILKKLDELGLAQNTLVLFTADHGEMLGDHGLNSKMMFYEGSAHIPLLMRLPGAIPAGRRVATPVAQYDLFPTLLDYLGVPAARCDGRSLRKLIDGQPDPIDFAISEWSAGKTVPSVMIRDPRYKLITSHYPDSRSIDALYDLANDPAEMHNLIASAASNRAAALAIAERLKGKIISWYERIHSPRLEGLKQHKLK